MNQYTQRTVPGFAEVQGRASTDATVTVNLQPTLRQGPYWRSELAVNNGVSPVLLGVTNVAVLRGAGAGGTDLVASNTGSLFLPQTPETFTHDADGNLTRDGRWTNYWTASAIRVSPGYSPIRMSACQWSRANHHHRLPRPESRVENPPARWLLALLSLRLPACLPTHADTPPLSPPRPRLVGDEVTSL